MLSDLAVSDLALDRIIKGLDPDGKHEQAVRSVLTALTGDPDVIRYRQDVLADLLNDQQLSRALRDLLPQLAGLTQRATNWGNQGGLMPVMARLSELDQYVSTLESLSEALDTAGSLQSEGLLRLREAVRQMAADPMVATLRESLPELRDLVGQTVSVTIGMNLGPDLRPQAATLLEVNKSHFRGERSLLSRLLQGPEDSSTSGISPLQQIPPGSSRQDSSLYRDMERLLEATAAPLAKALGRYRDVRTGAVVALEPEVAFYTGAIQLIERLTEARVRMCRPAIASPGESVFDVRSTVSAGLALQILDSGSGQCDEVLVPNDARFDAATRTLVVTGPNRGGKTTYCRAIGQAQVMFQAGLSVPGTEARISPVDAVYTLFPVSEANQPGMGRLDNEVQKIREIFQEATSRSLILLNEPLTSTSERSAFAIGMDLLRAFDLLGARVVFVTHLHDLAYVVAVERPVSSAITLTAQTRDGDEGVLGTFHILPGPPGGQSHASEIARQHGLTLEQLRQLIAERESTGAVRRQ